MKYLSRSRTVSSLTALVLLLAFASSFVDKGSSGHRHLTADGALHHHHAHVGPHAHPQKAGPAARAEVTAAEPSDHAHARLPQASAGRHHGEQHVQPGREPNGHLHGHTVRSHGDHDHLHSHGPEEAQAPSPDPPTSATRKGEPAEWSTLAAADGAENGPPAPRSPRDPPTEPEASGYFASGPLWRDEDPGPILVGRLVAAETGARVSDRVPVPRSLWHVRRPSRGPPRPGAPTA